MFDELVEELFCEVVEEFAEESDDEFGELFDESPDTDSLSGVITLFSSPGFGEPKAVPLCVVQAAGILLVVLYHPTILEGQASVARQPV